MIEELLGIFEKQNPGTSRPKPSRNPILSLRGKVKNSQLTASKNNH